MPEPKPAAAPAVAAEEAPAQAPASLLDQIVQEGRIGQSDEERALGKAWVKDFVGEIMKGTIKVSPDTDKMLNDRIADLDELISVQLNEVMHSPEFQRIESAWRGLAYLVNQTETSDKLKIRVMNISKDELLKDLTKAKDFDQSNIFKKIYEEEFGHPGGQPYGVLIGDYEFGRHNQDVTLVQEMSKIAANAHAPFIASASPAMFNWNDFTELAGVPDIEKVFDNELYLKWKMFRESEDSKYVGLCLPRVLARLPYGKDTVPVEEFAYEEKVSGKDHSKYLWTNAAYAFGARLTDAFAKHEWCAAIRGYEGCGLVEGLPTHQFQTDDGDIATKCPSEIGITDRREKEFSKAGFVPLCYYKNTDRAVFFAAQSANKAKEYLDAAATANAKLSAQLQYTMAVCRFAHFLKVMMRDKIGSFMERSQCEEFLNKWISNYVLLDDSAIQEVKAKFPLRDAKVTVTDDPASPGVYRAVVHLRPHFQLEELQVSLRLVAKLPAAK